MSTTREIITEGEKASCLKLLKILKIKYMSVIKTAQTFIVGSWAIKLDLLVHSFTNKNIFVKWV